MGSKISSDQDTTYFDLNIEKKDGADDKYSKNYIFNVGDIVVFNDNKTDNYYIGIVFEVDDGTFSLKYRIKWKSTVDRWYKHRDINIELLETTKKKYSMYDSILKTLVHMYVQKDSIYYKKTYIKYLFKIHGTNVNFLHEIVDMGVSELFIPKYVNDLYMLSRISIGSYKTKLSFEGLQVISQNKDAVVKLNEYFIYLLKKHPYSSIILCDAKLLDIIKIKQQLDINSDLTYYLYKNDNKMNLCVYNKISYKPDNSLENSVIIPSHESVNDNNYVTPPSCLKIDKQSDKVGYPVLSNNKEQEGSTDDIKQKTDFVFNKDIFDANQQLTKDNISITYIKLIKKSAERKLKEMCGIDDIIVISHSFELVSIENNKNNYLNGTKLLQCFIIVCKELEKHSNGFYFYVSSIGEYNDIGEYYKDKKVTLSVTWIS